MRVLILDEKLRPLSLSATRVLVTSDDEATPLALVLEYQKGPPAAYCAATCENPERLNLLLKRLGVDKTVFATDLERPRVDQFDFSKKGGGRG